MSHKKLIYLIAVLLMIGCASPDSNLPPPSVNLDHSVVSSKLPDWILNPDKPGYKSVVGSASKQDWGGRDAQYRVALMKARQELAQMIRVRVESTAQSRIEDRGGKINHDADVEIKLQSSEGLQLDDVLVIEEWVDPQSGELYLWLAIPQ